MKMHRIDSSVIHSIGYDAPSRTLRVLLRKGAMYEYDNVPPEAAALLLVGPSAGRAYNLFIKNGYPYRQISGEKAA